MQLIGRQRSHAGARPAQQFVGNCLGRIRLFGSHVADARRTLIRFRQRDDEHQPLYVEPVLDEVVGMLITLAFIPVDITAALIGFVLFRIFDVIKPFPARRFEALHGGLGVMADDAMAAIYANIALRLVLYLGARWL